MLRRSKTDGGAAAAPRLLVVNDDTAGCELVARILEANGFVAERVHEHTSAMLALGSGEPVDGVILDFTSGGTSTSLKLLDSIRHGDEANRNQPVVILSASANNRLFAFQSGVDAFLVRPFHADEMVAELRAVLARSDDDREAYRERELESARSA